MLDVNECISRLLRHWDHRLGNVHSSDDNQTQWWIMNVDKMSVMHAGLIETEGVVKMGGKRIVGGGGPRHNALLPAGDVGNQRHRLPIGAGAKKQVQRFTFHTSGST